MSYICVLQITRRTDKHTGRRERIRRQDYTYSVRISHQPGESTVLLKDHVVVLLPVVFKFAQDLDHLSTLLLLELDIE